MATYIQVLTDAGRDMIADAEAGETLTFTRVQLGENLIPPANIPGIIPPIPGGVMDATISGPPMRNQPFQVTIPATIVGTNIPRGFYMNAIVVWGQTAGTPLNIYSVGYPVLDDGVTQGGADFVGMPQGASVTEHYLRIATTVNRAIDVECIFDPLAVEVYVANIDEDVNGVPIPPDQLGAGVWSRRGTSPTGQAGSGYLLKRLKMGPGIEIVEDADTITIGVNTLQQDLDVYVPTTHPDLPVGGTAFDTIQEAHDYLLPFTIPSNRVARIFVAPGALTIASQININHPQGSQIRIIGSTRTINHTVTAFVSQTGASGNYIVTLTVTGAIDFAVGDWVNLGNYFTQPQTLLNSLFEVTGIAGQNVSIRVVYVGALPAIGPVTTGTMRAFDVRVNVAVGQNGFNVGANGLGLLQDIFILGGGANPGYGIISIGNVNMTRVAVANFQGTNGAAMALNRASYSLTNVYVTRCNYAITAGGSVISIVGGWSSYNQAYGLQMSDLAICTIDNFFAVRNQMALFAGGNASINIVGCQCYYNTAAGFYAGSGGVIQVALGGTGQVQLTDAPGSDLTVVPFGQVLRGAGTNLFYGTASQAINTVTVNGVIAP